MQAHRNGRRRRSVQDELQSRIHKVLGRAAKSLEWKGSEKRRWDSRLEGAFVPGSAKAQKLGEHLFRLADRISGPATASETRRLSALLRLIAEAPRSATARDALSTAVTALRDGIEFETATAFWMEPGEGRLVPMIEVGSHVDLIPEFAFDHGVGISSWVAKTRRPILLSSLRRDAEVPETERPSAFLSIPIEEGEDLLAVLNLAHRRAGAFQEADRDLLLLAGEILAPVLRALEPSPARDSGVDSERGLATRRHLEVRIREEELASQRIKGSFAVVGVRLCSDTSVPPPLEAIRENELHDAIRECIAEQIGSEQPACRLTRDSFAVLLPQVTSQEAWRVATELRLQLESFLERTQRNADLNIASVLYPIDAESGSGLLSRVEGLLGIDGKHNGSDWSQLRYA